LRDGAHAPVLADNPPAVTLPSFDRVPL